MASISKYIRHLFTSLLPADAEGESRQVERDDRETWEQAWRNCSHRRIESPIRIDVGLDSDFGKIVSVTISENPAEFSDKGWRETDYCPICGQTTVGAQRLAATIHPTFETGFSYGVGVWVHGLCFEKCPETGEPALIPW